ncbi:MAG TPA: GNAT family N-acetyltransferase [Ramlibacter sp.]|nr:GNAT family N-acetyltransferase [Ramlibacter sp.]
MSGALAHTQDPVRIRQAQPADAAALVPLLAQLGYPGAEAFIERRVAEQLRHPDALLLVAEVEDRVLGFMSLHFVPQLALTGDFCRLSYLCVDEQARGLGIGALLEQRAVLEARRRGCDRIELHSHQRRGAAHRFYFREGYEESPKYLVKRLA